MSSGFSPPPIGKPLTSDEKTWGMLAHLSGLIASAVGGMAFLGPLIVWLVKKDESPFVGDQAKEALNFQIAVMIAVLVCMVTVIGILLIPVVMIADLIYSIIAAMEANKGVNYRYPYTIRLIN